MSSGGRHLCLGEAEAGGKQAPLTPYQVLVAAELSLQGRQLFPAEGGAGPLGAIQIQTLGEHQLPHLAVGVWWEAKVAIS